MPGCTRSTRVLSVEGMKFCTAVDGEFGKHIKEAIDLKLAIT